jgi:hypothetical protein
MKTGIHRPSQIRPAEYSIVTFYSLATTQDGWPIPSFNVPFVLELMKKEKFATKSIGQCSVCGAHFVYGEVWRHDPTGEHIHIGWQCSDKYNLCADRAEFKAQRAVHVQAAMRVEKRRMIRAQIKKQLADDPELREALRVDHHITHDIRARYIQWGHVSPAQRNLLIKLLNEANAPVEDVNWIDVPEGRHLIEGTVLSAKYQESFYGDTFKMLVRVDTDAGSYKVWGTVPSSIEADMRQLNQARQDRNGEVFEEYSRKVAELMLAEDLGMDEAKAQLGEPQTEDHIELRGMTVRFKATLKAKETGFGFFSRPSNGEVVQ